jgi:hypothetical protein
MAFINAAIVKEKRLLRVITQTKAGNWIEEQTALATGKTIPEIRRARIAFDPTHIKDEVDLTLRERYRDAMGELLDRLDSSFVSLRSYDKFPMIWAGPMASVNSFSDLAREVFNDRSLEQTFPAAIIGQRKGNLPTTSVVQGLLKKAVGEYSPIGGCDSSCH